MPGILILLLVLFSPKLLLADLVNTFDENTGANSYSGGLGSGNWNDGGIVGLSQNAGTEGFFSAFSNSSGLGLTKILGDSIQNSTYDVSFFVLKYSHLGVPFSDFSTLYIGGPLGTTNWISTSTPTVTGEWVQWTGTYTPHPAEIGQPFKFGMVFDFVGPTPRGIGVDGNVSATARAVPEPSGLLLISASCLIPLGFSRSRKRVNR